MANRRFIDFPIASTVGDNDIVLIWQSGVNKQTTKATFLSGLPENLEDLNDVVISGLTNGQILRYDSVTGKWENTDQGNLDLNDLNDVSIVSPSNGQVLVYNSSTSKWENSSGGFVPYVGAVTTVDLGAQGLRAGYVRFDTSVASVPNEQGLMYWDALRSTAALIMNGTLQHIGQDTFFYVKNSSGSTIPKGTCVRFAGTDGASGHLLIVPFLANGSVPSSHFLGVTAEAITNGSFGQVMHFGELEGINTSGFTAGALLYASTTVAGGFQTTVPVAPNNIVLVAAAVNSKNNGAIVVRPTYGSNINIDEGVKITSPTTGDLLQLQAGGLWENKTLAQVIGSAYVPSTRTLTINGTAFDLSANRSWTVGDVRTDGSYSNPSWITALAWSKITGTPTTLSGYGITDAVPNSRTITINGVTQDLSANRTFNVGTVTSVGLSSATSGVTIGGSPVTGVGAFTLTIATASGSQQGLLSASDWTTFNNKQNTLTNPVTGTGTTNYLPKFTGSTTIGNSNLINDASGNLGLGVTPSAWTLFSGVLELNGGPAIGGFSNTTYFLQNSNFDSGFKYKSNGSAGRYELGGQHSWWIAPSGTAGNAISFTQAMTLTSGGNLLVGTTTDNGARLQVSGTSTFSSWVRTFGDIYAANGTSTAASIRFWDANSGLFHPGSDALGFITNGTQKMLLNSSGNLGLGVTPNTWTGTGVKAFQFQNGSLAASNTFGALFGWNTYYEGTYKYVSNTTASAFLAAGNDFIWYQAPSGTAGNTISFTQAMTLTSGGNLLVGTTTDNGARLQVSGEVNINSGATRGLRIDTNNGVQGISLSPNSIFGVDEPGIGNGRFIINTSGNVGIANNSPSFRLDVSGTGRYLQNNSSLGNATGITLQQSGSGDIAISYQLTGVREWLVGIDNSDSDTFKINNITGSSDFNNVGLAITTTGAATFSSSVTTGAPAGGTAQPWKLGTVATVSPTSPNRTIEVEVNGTTYYLHAKTTNN